MASMAKSIVQTLSTSVGGYDALPLLDTEYNHPEVQRLVLQLIQDEMKSFAPPKDQYLENLPYPKLRFNGAPGFAAEYERICVSSINNGVNVIDNPDEFRIQKPLDMARYNVPAPSSEFAEDVQAWKSAVNNARAQLEHQQNRLMNLELNIEYGDKIWQQHVNSLHAAAKTAQNLADGALQEKNNIDAQRINLQRMHAPILAKAITKRRDALHRVRALQGVLSQLGCAVEAPTDSFPNKRTKV